MKTSSLALFFGLATIGCTERCDRPGHRRGAGRADG